VANEVIRSRASVLKENLDRWGYTNIIVSNNDPRQFSKLEGFFDAILVDAPCSGSGMFRKDPETQLHWSTEAVEHCSLRQKRILNEVWSSLKNDGVLIYSTCSYSEAENEAQLQEILETRQAQYLPIPALENLTGIVKPGLGYRFYPGKIQGEGFYLAMLKKVNSQQNFDSRSKPDILPIPSFLNNWLLDNETFTSVKTHLGESIFPKSQLIYLYSLLKHLHILKCGTLIGEWKGQRFFPDHELALSIQLSGKIPRLELNLEDALNYLKKESLKNPSLSSGIQLICYQGLALGWGNALPNRINNLLPKSWRIRKEIERFSD
jgi:NOL1/NOP2/fmu family ribosome biogenesis protein